ncbi:SGNH/GDSL hydrolase family protein [Xylocopilactobacillus apicola]|uniref:SGNH hydrolase-type esterase domain-containing protein n=1 Tax=Xylocopilactobacillus apicola TaxID=2932184 RepID=A0AAU9CXX6_9LACO|nr:SGNH/GDSL hydrolase family protein [Xylocopilactobacillus apicola]BDR58874.1 hypothetical protein XA3_13150 [Xylocopilactobacillus apicola]
MKKKGGLFVIFQLATRILLCSFLLIFAVTVTAHFHRPLRTYEKTSVNPMRNQTVVIFGDSVSYGETRRNTISEYSYLPSSMNYLGAKKVINRSIPGSGIMVNHGFGYSWQNILYAIQKYEKDVKKADIVIIAAGRNDTVIPNMHDYQLKTNLTNDLEEIKKINKNARIYGILPWDGLAAEPDKKKSDYHSKITETGYTLNRVADILAEVYQQNDVYYFDPRKSTEEFNHVREEDFGDGLTHPSDLMFKKMSGAMINWFTAGNTIKMRRDIKIKSGAYMYQSAYDALVKDHDQATLINEEKKMFCSNNLEYNGKYIVTVYQSESDFKKAKNPSYVYLSQTDAMRFK